MQRDIEVFAGNTSQYIFISSASVYEKPPRHYVITEEQTPAVNPYWPYSQDKIACEELVKGSKNLPWTIVRPSHTVRSGMPTMVNEGDIVPQRMLAGQTRDRRRRRRDALDPHALRGFRKALSSASSASRRR